ncbi:hypothetical protein OJF2_47390 [Aquisphaera giovannonii]|uniref:Uncharacterized protein n=1 Tax=Aquisphaera giovannonii TaxID=406548 RepID=A0A5B9W7R8_9BACT|nr:hypothetical protein [Aquisphaera giovannonii]QEH36179.1 hypothetical protein OJF2_47390 [Aquisphaera giovannonii]
MADSDPKKLTDALKGGTGQAPMITLVLLLATTVSVFNLSSGKPAGSASGTQPAEAPAPAAPPTAAAPAVDDADALESLDPLIRFLNLGSTPPTLEALGNALDGYRVTTLIATLSDPKDSRLGYDFDMATEAIQRAIESEGYSLDRFRYPWLDPGPAPAAPAVAAVPAPAPAAPAATPAPSPTPATPKAATPAAAPAPAPATVHPVAVIVAPPAAPAKGPRYERQPGVILFRIDRPAPEPDKAPAPQELLLLLLVGETPTWGIQQQALSTSLDIAWELDFKRNLKDFDRDPAIRILAPTYSGTADSMTRVFRAWGARPGRELARIWVCSGAATTVDKVAFERNSLPAKVLYAATVIPDEILLRSLFRYMAHPSGHEDPTAPPLPRGKIALLVESGSGYGISVGQGYGTSGKTEQSRQIISIPFPSQIAQVRASQAGADAAAAKGRVSIPFDPPTGRQNDRLPALSPKMTIATDSLILANILATISSEDIRYLGIVATDILDVIYLTRLIRENCPDVQIFLVGSDLRYTDPSFTLDFRGTIIASSYPLDARAQVWSFPFEGSTERRLFANEFDLGRYNAGLVLLNGVKDPNHEDRLVVDSSKAEDLLIYGRPFVATFMDSVNRRPQVWINQVGQFNVWPLQVLSLNECDTTLRAQAEDLIPAVASLDPMAESKKDLHFRYDFPLVWKLFFCAGTFLVYAMVGLFLYTHTRGGRASSRTSVFDPLLQRLDATRDDRPRKRGFLVALALTSAAIPYCLLAAPVDVALPPRVAPAGEGEVRLVVGMDIYALAAVGVLTMLGMLVPLSLCAYESLRRRRGGRPEGAADPSATPPAQAAPPARDGDRWLTAEGGAYRGMTFLVAATGIACILYRLYQFAVLRPSMPNDWMALDRSAHLLGGISPIVPVGCLGAAIFWWAYLELKRIYSYPLLRRGVDLLSLEGMKFSKDSPWRQIIPRMNARFRFCVDLLEYPVSILISKNLPLAGLMLAAAGGILAFVWGVVWPRFITTPDGRLFDLLVMLGFMGYLLLLLYSQVRYLWLWKSLMQLFRQVSLLPMADAFGSIPPRVAAKFGRFLRTSLHDDADLEIPLQQCRLLLGTSGGAAGTPGNSSAQEALRALVAIHEPGTDMERFEIVSTGCVRPVISMAWPHRTLEQSYGGSMGGPAAPAPPASADEKADEKAATAGLDPATIQWLSAAEGLLALRIVYLVSQFAAPLRSMSSQLIYGPILLLLAIAWYPFHPQSLMAIMIWVFIICGVLATLLVLFQIERDDFVSRVSRTAPNALKLDQNMISNLAPYVVPVAGFLFTAFPSLGFWIGSLLEPIGRAVK